MKGVTIISPTSNVNKSLPFWLKISPTIKMPKSCHFEETNLRPTFNMRLRPVILGETLGPSPQTPDIFYGYCVP